MIVRLLQERESRDYLLCVCDACVGSIRGIMMAFLAIFPASATLVEKHEREKKREAGILKTKRGRQAAALDAYGASLGAVGLLGFGLIVWIANSRFDSILVLILATCTWIATSVLLWRLNKSPFWL